MKEKKVKVVVGLGATGISCVRHLTKQGHDVVAVDTRLQPPGLAVLKEQYPDVPVFLGPLSDAPFHEANTIVISPGVSLKEPVIARQIAAGVPVVGDIELFAREVKKPVLAITGSNGKTTVTSLLGEMAKMAGLQVAVGGNIGTPVLDLLTEPEIDLFVLELSSFQLETTTSLKPVAATVLNVSPDHLDRYDSYREYVAAKQTIYQHCDTAIINASAPEIWRDLHLDCSLLSFSSTSKQADFYLQDQDGKTFLAYQGQTLLPVSEMPLKGRHHNENALAALALGVAAKLPMEAMLKALRTFTGLPHRCQRVSTLGGVDWFNDSKGTNVGATQTAIATVSGEIDGKIVLIAGGLSKGADFSPLLPCIQSQVKAIVLIGEDAKLIEEAFSGQVAMVHAESLSAAVSLAAEQAHKGDAVLLSPACASFDMFKSFEDRGNQFVAEVKQL